MTVLIEVEKPARTANATLARRREAARSLVEKTAAKIDLIETAALAALVALAMEEIRHRNTRDRGTITPIDG